MTKKEKEKLFELTYFCDIYRYQMINYTDSNPDYDKDLDGYKSFYDGFSHAMDLVLSKTGLKDEYIDYAENMDDLNGYSSLDTLPKLDNPFEIPDILN